jgi:hypothetical protein
MMSSFDSKRLDHALRNAGGIDGDALRVSHPSLFSATALTLPAPIPEQLAELISAIEFVIATPEYQSAALAWAPAIARRSVAARGVFFGYDVHLSSSGPRLIEINTNAGGALLNACLLRAHGADELADQFEHDIVAMLREEWQLSHPNRPLERVAIVDEQPASQYLAPEFQLFRCLFERHGINAVIADPADLDVRDGRLLSAGAPIDLIYNRLTDFALDSTVNAQIRAVFESGGVVLTPHPRAHGVYADKRNLILLSDRDRLTSWGVPQDIRRLLHAGVPATIAVNASDAARLWSERKRWFFKPASGFGSRAAYRGDKLTKRVFEDIVQGGYIAQEIVLPSEHPVEIDGVVQSMKLDIRAYVYSGQIQRLAGRLYQGQTTNFRTPGGGFAPVFTTRESAGIERGQKR